jgi:putative FmdB family regulatory protein
MPTYDYECDACGHSFEQFQSITAPVTRKCPACGRLKLRRLIGTGAGIIFKGSGFYCTDYRDKTYSASAKKDKEGASAASGAASSGAASESSNSKPAETAPAAPAKGSSKSKDGAKG